MGIQSNVVYLNEIFLLLLKPEFVMQTLCVLVFVISPRLCLFPAMSINKLFPLPHLGTALCVSVPSSSVGNVSGRAGVSR